MATETGRTDKKKKKCPNCEGRGTLKKGDKVVRCSNAAAPG
jgi:DnaJ-class molecular chaperone